MKKYRIKKWVKVATGLLITIIIGITIYQSFIVETIKSTPVGNYTCRGGLIKVCTGSKEVAEYLGN